MSHIYQITTAYYLGPPEDPSGSKTLRSMRCLSGCDRFLRLRECGWWERFPADALSKPGE
jgi:hypothetical protein